MRIDSFNGLYNLPTQIITVNTEVALLVPASVGIYPAYPSPQFPANSGFVVSAGDDIATSNAYDGHVFSVYLAGKIANPGAGNLTVKLYQVPLAQFGQIGAAGCVTSAGAPGTGVNNLDSISTTTPASGHIWVQWDLMWDSVVAKLDGVHSGAYNNNAITSAAVGTQLTSNVAAVSALNFMPTFTFATANAANSVTLTEFGFVRK